MSSEGAGMKLGVRGLRRCKVPRLRRCRLHNAGGGETTLKVFDTGMRFGGHQPYFGDFEPSPPNAGRSCSEEISEGNNSKDHRASWEAPEGTAMAASKIHSTLDIDFDGSMFIAPSCERDEVGAKKYQGLPARYNAHLSAVLAEMWPQ